MSKILKKFKKKMGKVFSCLESKDNSSKPELPYRRRVVIVGDGECGKTCLVTRMCTGDFVDVGYLPTVFETEVIRVNTGKEDVDLTIFDTAGQEDYDRLRPFSYLDIDVAIISFNLADTDTLMNVTEKWSPEVRYFCGNIPIILVGNKKDLRDTSETPVKTLPLSSLSSVNSATFDGDATKIPVNSENESEDNNNNNVNKSLDTSSESSSSAVEIDNRLSRLISPSVPKPRDQPHVKHSEGTLIASRIGAVAYFEISALSGDNVQELLLATTKASVLGSKKSKKFKPFLDTLQSWKSRSGVSQRQYSSEGKG